MPEKYDRSKEQQLIKEILGVDIDIKHVNLEQFTKLGEYLDARKVGVTRMGMSFVDIGGYDWRKEEEGFLHLTTEQSLYLDCIARGVELGKIRFAKSPYDPEGTSISW